MSEADDAIDILLVEDDKRLATLTATYLQQNGFRVAIEHRGDRALANFRNLAPRAVVLDLMLPGLDGLSLCRELRQQFHGPILMLTAKGGNIDQVVGLAAGADDYVAKPVEPMVLVARLRALLRRAESAEHQIAPDDIRIGNLFISRSAQLVRINEQEVALSTQEFEVLYALARGAGTVLSRESLLRTTRGIDYDGLDRSIDVRISKLRKKLGDTQQPPSLIKTIWGKGYLLVADISPDA